MKFFQEFERKYSRYAIQNLMYYIVVLYGMGLFLQLVNPMLYWNYLSLDAPMILQGQIWRVITFLVYPPSLGNSVFSSIFFGVVALMLYYNLGQTLERVMGAFRFNLFFIMGVIGQVAASLVAYVVFHERIIMTTGFLNFSIFLAFAVYFPNLQFFLFFVLPIKAKWLAIAECAIYAFNFISGSLSTRVEIVISLANVIVFLLLTQNTKRYAPKEVKRRQEFRREVKMKPQGAVRHKCAVCGKTELDGEQLEFRFCSKCEGSYEYCQEHLYTHQHIKKDSNRNDEQQG